ncbi:MAG: hypothetical protein E7A65_02400, partial [Anaerococcus vaginalis]|uniref:hypothetical protein n=1 Tax=Anaerococcus vaginalis TaxID=33037 RepID=UPI0028FF5DB4
FAPCKGRLRGFVERGLRGKIVGTIGSPLICPLSNEVLKINCNLVNHRKTLSLKNKKICI